MNTKEILKRLMYKKGVNTTDIVRDTGISRSTIYGLLNNKIINPQPKTIKTLADYFEVTPDYLLDIEDEKPVTQPAIKPSNEEVKIDEARLLYLREKYLEGDRLIFRGKLTDVELYCILNWLEKRHSIRRNNATGLGGNE